MTTQAQTPEERLSKLEGAYEQVNERLGDLTQGQAALRAETNERFNELAQAVREGDAALGEQIRQVEANLRAEVKDEIRGVRTEIRTVLLLLGTFWATTLGGIIAILVRG